MKQKRRTQDEFVGEGKTGEQEEGQQESRRAGVKE